MSTHVVSQTGVRRGPRRRRRLSRRRSLTGLLLISPAILLVGVFFLAPLVLAIVMSFHSWPLLGEREWIGLDNYLAIPGDQTFLTSLSFTLKYTVIVTPVLFFVGLGLAYLVRERRRGVGVFRTIYFMPFVVGFAAAAYLWLFLLDPSVGPANRMLLDIGLIDEPLQWANSSSTALFVVIAMVTWKMVGFQMIILMNGLQSIPADVQEAAVVDGAGRWAMFRRITLPLLRPSIALVLVFSVAGSLLAFEQFFIMTAGAPNNETLTVVYWIYTSSFVNFQLGYGAAMSVVVLIVLMTISAIQLLLLRDRTEY